MAQETIWYGNGLRRVVAGDIDWVNDDIRLAMCSSSYTPNQDTHEDWTDITNEVTGAVYVTKGQALTGQTITYDSATNRVWLNADDVTWSSETLTGARFGILHKYNASDASDYLLAWINFDTDRAATAEDFVAQFATNDVLYIEATTPS